MNIFDYISKDFEYLEVDNEVIFKGQLLEEIVQFSGNFEHGKLYAFCEKLSLRQVVLYLSCIYSGAIPVMVAHPSSKVSSEVFEKRLEDLRSKGVSNFIFEANSVEKKIGQKSFNDIAFCQLSSGTTGVQKCYGITHEQLLNQVNSYRSCLKSERLNVVSWLPLYHDMGLITSIFLPLLTGNKSVIIETFNWTMNVGSLFDKIDQSLGTHCWLPNFCFEILTKRDHDFKNVSDCEFINCSEPCKSFSMNLFFEKYRAKMSACYAMAENVFAVTQSEGFFESESLVSCGGRTIPGTEMEIRSNGDIFIRGNSLYSFEYNNGWIERDRLEWFETGDIGFVKDGHFFISGRRKEMFIVGGKNIFANQVESIVNSIPGVKSGRCVVFSVPSLGTETLVVMFEGERGEEFKNSVENPITKKCKDLLDVFVEVHWVRDGTLIKTSSGKLCREKNRERYLVRRGCIEFAKSHVFESVGCAVSQFTELKSRGILDSFRMMELLVAIHKNANKQIDWSKNYANVDSIMDIIDECI